MANQNLEFGNRLKTFRTLNGLTQGEVAEVLKLDRSTYTYYEKGRVPNLDTLNKLSKLFNVSVAELIGERDDRLTLSKTQAGSCTLRASF